MSELVLVIPREMIPRRYLPDFGFISVETLEDIPEQEFYFEAREIAEASPEIKQVIPYILFMNHENRILTYRRNSSEHRLKNLYSVGLGGHINPTDTGYTLMKTVEQGMSRELREETGISYSEVDIRFLGFINEERSKVGLVHWGWVYAVKIPEKIRSTFADEIKDVRWYTLEEIRAQDLHFEYWSELALQLLEKTSTTI